MRKSKAYLKVYKRCGLKPIITEASGGTFSKFSHEFQVLTEKGEDTIFFALIVALAEIKK